MNIDILLKSLPTLEDQQEAVRLLAAHMLANDKGDALLLAIGVPLLEELHVLAARARLSRMVITEDCRILLVDYDNREVEMQPVHKAVYLLFLNHPEGIEFKRLSEHADELRRWYRRAAPNVEQGRIDDAVARLTNPLDNAINEKCSRIKSIFMGMMDEYTASYYIIAGHSRRSFSSSKKMWFTRCRRIGLPRELLSIL